MSDKVDVSSPRRVESVRVEAVPETAFVPGYGTFRRVRVSVDVEGERLHYEELLREDDFRSVFEVVLERACEHLKAAVRSLSL